jgi:hypothetical protein
MASHRATAPGGFYASGMGDHYYTTAEFEFALESECWPDGSRKGMHHSEAVGWRQRLLVALGADDAALLLRLARWCDQPDIDAPFLADQLRAMARGERPLP